VVEEKENGVVGERERVRVSQREIESKTERARERQD
jgi:hypothetical protein